ncbi:gamma-glutamyltransferase [Acetobacteraceae bacterium H6797]|nr:gamma-glutamyltransferase [Acetobacteraceae bacterium H6797]
MTDWRSRAGSLFTCEKQPARGSRGMVVSNHPLATSAGAEMLAAGGNAVDAAIATLFTLTVVEPMMVGILGGGVAQLRLPDGQHVIVDGFSTAPAAAREDMYRVVEGPAGGPGGSLPTEGNANVVGALAIATPGNTLSWCEILRRYGSLPLADILAPAIRHAERGFAVTPYLADCIQDAAGDFAKNPAIAAVFMPGGTPLKAGDRLINADYAETLKALAAQGPGLIHGGPLGTAIAEHLQSLGGILTAEDIAHFKPLDREPVRGSYRGFEVIGPPPPTSGGVHVVQMLNILEGYDIAGLGFGTPETLHLIGEAMKIAFADRGVATTDPAFVKAPIAKLIDKAYADERRAQIDPEKAKLFEPGISTSESANTTHVTVADAKGGIVTMTQTINSLFGARVMIPGTGLIPNNYMANFDPRPGLALSIAPGKRITSSMAPLILLKGGKPAYALGLPGGLRIFTSAMQAVLNLVDHKMSLQEAVEAPRIWSQGPTLEVEPTISEAAREGLAKRGQKVTPMPTIGGGMNAIAFGEGGALEGAACWRADGTAMGLGGGLARPGVRFVLGDAKPKAAS